MARKSIVAVCSLLMAFGFVSTATPVAEASSFHVDVEAPVVIGDQTFTGERLSFESIGFGTLLAVELDGRRVAIVDKPYIARGSADDAPVFSFRIDRQQRWHLQGIKSEGGSKLHRLRVAAVAEGDVPSAGESQSTLVARTATGSPRATR